MTLFLSRWHLAVFFCPPMFQPTKSGIKEKGAWKATKVNLNPGFFTWSRMDLLWMRKTALMDELCCSQVLSKRGGVIFCWETLRIFCGMDVACTNFWLNGKTICKENDGFREMVNQLLAILFIHESTLEALQLLMHHTLGQERSRGHYLWWHAWQRIPQCSWIHHCSAWM